MPVNGSLEKQNTLAMIETLQEVLASGNESTTLSDQFSNFSAQLSWGDVLEGRKNMNAGNPPTTIGVSRLKLPKQESVWIANIASLSRCVLYAASMFSGKLRIVLCRSNQASEECDWLANDTNEKEGSISSSASGGTKNGFREGSGPHLAALFCHQCSGTILVDCCGG